MGTRMVAMQTHWICNQARPCNAFLLRAMASAPDLELRVHFVRPHLQAGIERGSGFLDLDLGHYRQVPRRLAWSATLFRIMAVDRIFCNGGK